MFEKRKIITFSGRMRSGKGVLSRMMQQQFGAETFSMASHLKELCIKILDIESPALAPWNIDKMNIWKNESRVLEERGIFLSEAAVKTISDITGFNLSIVKEKTKNISFRNVRELLQLIGTNVIRQIDCNWHIKKTIEDIEQLPENTIACIDDIRFKNELEAFREYGADTFFIIRTNGENISNHDSETELSHFDFPDNHIILNIDKEKPLCDEFVYEFGNNNFEDYVNIPILLSQVKRYKNVNRLFGTEKNEMVEELIKINKYQIDFLLDGYITVPKNSKYEINKILEEMKIDVIKNVNVYEFENYYAIDNPIAYENLKRWL